MPNTESGMVLLKNGEKVPKAIVITTMVSLKALRQNSPGVFMELVSACTGPKHEFSQIAKQKLQKRAFMENDNIHRSIKDIVISSVSEDLKIEDPLET